MANKNIIIGICVTLAVVVVGYFLFAPASLPFMNTENTSDVPTQGKLDMNVVCNSALAYMSFPDGKSAELFVEECKEGKHPQVIEDYKARMGLGAGAEI